MYKVFQKGNVIRTKSSDFFNEISKSWGELDFLVHSVAFSDKNELKGGYIETTRENFINTLNVSLRNFLELDEFKENILFLVNKISLLRSGLSNQPLGDSLR